MTFREARRERGGTEGEGRAKKIEIRRRGARLPNANKLSGGRKRNGKGRGMGLKIGERGKDAERRGLGTGMKIVGPVRAGCGRAGVSPLVSLGVSASPENAFPLRSVERIIDSA